ncbi:transcriptional regulator [Methanocella sp. CWC-04]|uniref:Transcriptional regulator n=1 Tax=Methanooceanicella nereidis TaxID=2052831 RepID=A0AAP2W3X8_9EURY|nr:transcriptional regulator [Methanocella sp. CWC-04]
MEEIVHIVPLGFEIDRVIKPFEKLRANRVYLLYRGNALPTKKGDARAKDPGHFLSTVKVQLEDMGISVVLVETEIFDVLELLKAVSGIILKEKLEKNIVYVNMCAAGRLSSVASTLAAMYHDVKVYYVKADDYPTEGKAIIEHGLSIVEKPNYSILTNFTIDIPTGAKGIFLAELYRKGEMTTNDIIKMIEERKLPGFDDLNEAIKGKERTLNNKLVRINMGLLRDLEHNNYIEVEKRGRKKIIKITDKGSYAACLIGEYTENFPSLSS